MEIEKLQKRLIKIGTKVLGVLEAPQFYRLITKSVDEDENFEKLLNPEYDFFIPKLKKLWDKYVKERDGYRLYQWIIQLPVLEEGEFTARMIKMMARIISSKDRKLAQEALLCPAIFTVNTYEDFKKLSIVMFLLYDGMMVSRLHTNVMNKDGELRSSEDLFGINEVIGTTIIQFVDETENRTEYDKLMKGIYYDVG